MWLWKSCLQFAHGISLRGMGEILTVFLGLYPVVQATGEALFLALTECLCEHRPVFGDCIPWNCL